MRGAVGNEPLLVTTQSAPGGSRGFEARQAEQLARLGRLLQDALVHIPADEREEDRRDGEQSREDLNRIPLVVSYGMGHMGSIAHVAALDAGRGWLAEVLRELDDSRALLARLVADHLPDVLSVRAAVLP